MREATASFQLDRAELVAEADRLAETYRNAMPFPHIVIDGLLPGFLLDDVLAEYPEPEDAPWQSFDNTRELKLALADIELMGPATRHVLALLNSQTFIDFLEHLTGIDGLIPDPHYTGGGLHQIRRGGFLKVHADFNRHERLKLDRRLNVLVYLNHDWEESYGGHLELWDTEMTACVERVLPLFGRMVVFSTTDFSHHGHPDPLACPEQRARRSLAWYYYTNGRPAEEVSSSHTTTFRARPGEDMRRSWRDVASRWVPPVIYDAARRVRARMRGRATDS